MGSSSSKPSKSKPSKVKYQNPPRKIRRPAHPPISRPLNYPSLAPLPLPPLNKHYTRPSTEQVAADRYRKILADNPTFAGTQKPKASHQPPPRRPAPAPQPSRNPQPAKPPPKQKAPYQFRPLDEIGRAPKPKYPPRSSSKPPGPPPSRPLPQPPKQVQGKPQARYGGLRKNGKGVWEVKVLADGRWYRCEDVGVRPPGF
ncbi:MAG: hypothetical protein Q9161_004001 [Pseudevernia consocians]